MNYLKILMKLKNIPFIKIMDNWDKENPFTLQFRNALAQQELEKHQIKSNLILWMSYSSYI